VKAVDVLDKPIKPHRHFAGELVLYEQRERYYAAEDIDSYQWRNIRSILVQEATF